MWQLRYPVDQAYNERIAYMDGLIEQRRKRQTIESPPSACVASDHVWTY